MSAGAWMSLKNNRKHSATLNASLVIVSRNQNEVPPQQLEERALIPNEQVLAYQHLLSGNLRTYAEYFSQVIAEMTDKHYVYVIEAE